MLSRSEYDQWFLALAVASGAGLTGKPDGSEPVTVVFSPESWRSFSKAAQPIAQPAYTPGPGSGGGGGGGPAVFGEFEPGEARVWGESTGGGGSANPEPAPVDPTLGACAECGKTSTANCMYALYCVDCITTKIAPAFQVEPWAYACPANCGCLWRDNKDFSMSLFGPKNSSCPVCEPLGLDKLVKVYLAPALATKPLLHVEDIERLETQLLMRRRRLRETRANPGDMPDPEFYDGFRAAEEYHGISGAPLTSQVPEAVPAEVLKAAQNLQSNGYKGPLAWASKVIDWVAKQPDAQDAPQQGEER